MIMKEMSPRWGFRIQSHQGRCPTHRAAALPGLEGLVVDITRGAGFHRVVDFDLGVTSAHLVVVISRSRGISWKYYHQRWRGEGRSGGHKGEKGDNFGVLRCGRAEEDVERRERFDFARI
jgi:hypothetical protein